MSECVLAKPKPIAKRISVETCLKECTNHAETLIRTVLLDKPWQRLGADMFTLKSKSYLLVVDYYSGFIEIANLTDTKAADVTANLKSCFPGMEF